MKTPGTAAMSCFSKFALTEEYILDLARDVADFRLVSVIWGPVLVVRWRGVVPG